MGIIINGNVLVVKFGDTVRRLTASDVIYVESEKRRNIIHCFRENITYYGSIEKLSEELPDGFYRIHKGYIINMRYIEKYDRTQVYMKGGSALLISKYRYNAFVENYMRYLRKN